MCTETGLGAWGLSVASHGALLWRLCYRYGRGREGCVEYILRQRSVEEEAGLYTEEGLELAGGRECSLSTSGVAFGFRAMCNVAGGGRDWSLSAGGIAFGLRAMCNVAGG